jgi:hypothetical protein
MNQKLLDVAKDILSSGTHGKPTPKPIDLFHPFACVALLFLEDWRDKRLTADEVCETLLAAAITRNLLGGAVPRARKPEQVKKIVVNPIDDKNFDHMIETAQLILKGDSDVNGHELAELFLHFATRRMTPDEELRVLLADAKEKP